MVGLTVLVVAAGLINLFVMGRRISQKIVKNAKFRYNQELAKRFVSDFKLPISVVYPEYVYASAWNSMKMSMTQRRGGMRMGMIDNAYEGKC